MSAAPSAIESGGAVDRPRRRLCIVMGGHWSAQLGGAQFQAKCLLEALRPHGELDVHYLAHRVRADFVPDGYRIVRVGSDRMRWARLLAPLPSLYRELSRLRPDFIYQRSLTPFTGVCAYYARRHGARFVFHVASEVDAKRVSYKGWKLDAWVLRISRKIAEYGLRNASAVVAQTQDQARTLAAEYAIDVEAVVPNFHPEPRSHGRAEARERVRVRVIWVANFKSVKRPEAFVRLAEAFRHRDDVEFVMIGRPGGAEHHGRLRERMEALPLLRYLGEQPLEAVEREIGASDLLVNTSSYEGFPNTFIQAWLQGVPVLSSDVDPDGCLNRGGAGICAGSVEAMTGALERLLEDRVRLRHLGTVARDYARRNHGFEHGERLIQIIVQTPATQERSDSV